VSLCLTAIVHRITDWVSIGSDGTQLTDNVDLAAADATVDEAAAEKAMKEYSDA
jgi:hypothetical protein